jgi:hypothetical protein
MSMKSVLRACVCLGAAVLLVPSGASASVTAPVPEIGPGSISAGLALLAGGVLLLRTRRRK